MAIKKLTDLALRHLKPTDKVQMISDGGGLVVRIRSISEGGAMSYMQTYRFDGKQYRITLKANTLANARKECEANTALLKQGIDPRIERKLVMQRTKQAQIAEQAEQARVAALTNVGGLFTRWVDVSIRERKDLPEVKRMFEKDVLPFIGGLMVHDVRQSHITDLVENMTMRGAKHSARNMLKLVRQMFRYAVYKGLIEFDPTASISVVTATVKPTERERWLTDLEITTLAVQLPDAGLLPSTKCAVWIALSTMCRVGELSKAKRADVNLEQKTWVIPAYNSKNGKPHTIYLSDFALEQFTLLLNASSHDAWLFPSTDGLTHVSEKSITKQLGDRQTGNPLAHRSKYCDALVLTGGKWTPHDLRRTGATIMGALGVAPDVIEKCLNHTEVNKMKRIYQRQELKAEQAEAWRVLGERLALLINR